MKLNHFLMIFTVPKIILLGRGVLQLISMCSGPRTVRIKKLYGADNFYLFYVRCLFRDYPVALISALFICSLFLSAYIYRVCEMHVNPVAKLEYFENALWLTILGMTSVGYGDVYPITHIGSILSFISSFLGVIATSLFVLSITLNLEMKLRKINFYAEEERSLLLLKQI